MYNRVSVQSGHCILEVQLTLCAVLFIHVLQSLCTTLHVYKLGVKVSFERVVLLYICWNNVYCVICCQGAVNVLYAQFLMHGEGGGTCVSYVRAPCC